MKNKTWLLYCYEGGGILCEPFNPKQISPRELYRRILLRNGENYYDTQAFVVSLNKNGQMIANEVWFPELENKR